MWTLFRRVKRTGFPDEELLSVYRDHGVIPTSSRDDNFNKPSLDLTGYQLVEPGDLATNKMKTWQGSIAISRFRGIVSPAYFIYRPTSEQHDQFLHYLLRSDPYVAEYGRISKGVRVNQWDLDDAAFRSIPVPFPDLDTQKAIADFLDKETARIDQLIEKKQRLVELLGERRLTLIARQFTGDGEGTVPEGDLEVSQNGGGNVDRREAWFGNVPKSWPVVRNKHAMRLVSEVVGARSSEIALLSLTNRGVIARDLESGKGKFPASFDTYQQVREGDLVFCLFDIDETPRTVGLSQLSGMITGAYSVFRPTHRASGRFLSYFYHSIDDRKGLRPFYTGLRKVVRNDTFLSLPIPLPDLDTQNAVADFLDKETARIDKVREITNASIDRLKEYRSALITAAVTGQIDVTRWGRTGEGDRRLEVIEGGLQGQASVSSPKPKASIAALVAAEIVHRHREERRFGRVTLQKLLYLAEAHIGIDGCEGDYERRAAGPFDEELISRVEAEMRQAEFYAVRQDGRGERVEYTPLRKAGRHKADLGAALGDKSRELARLIDLFVPTETRFSEKIATIYAVWNDALIDGEQPRDERIIRGVREEWHVEKLKFSPEELAEGIAWIRKRGLEPKGSGPTTSTQGGLF